MSTDRLLIATLGLLAATSIAAPPAIPPPISPADYPALLERPPFRRILTLSDSLVLSGVAKLPAGKVVTVWDRTSGRSFLVSNTPNPQGWRLLDLTESTDLRSVTATIAAGEQKITVRFNPERLVPPKLDNTSKPAPRGEGAVVVEALLRSLHPSAAREFEGLPATAQESFRKAFSGFLSAYPTASDARRLEFIHRALEEVQPSKGETKTQEKPPAEPPADTPAKPQ